MIIRIPIAMEPILQETGKAISSSVEGSLGFRAFESRKAGPC